MPGSWPKPSSLQLGLPPGMSEEGRLYEMLSHSIRVVSEAEHFIKRPEDKLLPITNDHILKSDT